MKAKAETPKQNSSGSIKANNRGENILPVENVAEAFLLLLAANGVDFIFLNPGSETVPIQKAVATCRKQGRKVPEVVLCLHESATMAAAHGYFMVSGNPSMAMVHQDVGTQNLGGNVHNAWRGRAGIIISAGHTPWAIDKGVPGCRNSYLHWVQDIPDQSSIVRNYVKWDYELQHKESLHYAVPRAVQMACTEPQGPVYFTFSRAMMLEKMESVRILPPARYGPAITPQADADSLRQAAEALLDSESPVVTTAYAGRRLEAVSALAKLADLLALPVIEGGQLRTRVNMPTAHPMHLGYDEAPRIERADVVLTLDQDVSYIPSQVQLSPQARIIQIDIDPIKKDIPTWGFPVDLPICADSAKALPVLLEIAKDMLTTERRKRIDSRRKRLEAEHLAQRNQWREAALTRSNQKPIAPEWLMYCINEVLAADDIVVQEAASCIGVANRYLERSQPGTYFAKGGGSLGWGLGAALGAKMAAPDRRVVCISSDGAFIYGHPMSSLWAAEAYGAPFLTIVLNNGGYKLLRQALERISPSGYILQREDMVGVNFDPVPDYTLLARSCHAYSERVENPSDVMSTLKRALDNLRNGRAAVLDVVL